MEEIQIYGSFIALIAAIVFAARVMSKGTQEEKLSNYKNIALMASNLVNCKVGTRKKVLTDLYLDPDWTENEVDELKGVLEGMLKTRLTIDKPGFETKGIKTIQE